MSLATLNGSRVVRATAQIPQFGIWWADCELDEETSIVGNVTLKISDLELEGTIVSGGPFRGASRYQIVGGFGGWRRDIDKKGYTNDAGVKLSNVLRDAAAAAGESLDEETLALFARSVGAAYTRLAGPASRVLQDQVPEQWHMGIDGVTRLGLRTSSSYVGDATRVEFDRAAGRIELAADEIATLLPGIVVDGLEAVDVRHTYEDRKIRTTIWGRDSGASSLARLLVQALPDLRCRGVSEFRVVTQEGDRVNLQPVLSRLGLPDLRRVPVRPGIPGARADLTLGSCVLVAFVNADPGRPVVVGFEDSDRDGFSSVRLDLSTEDDAEVDPLDVTGRVVRYGDPVLFPAPGQATILPGTPVALSRVRA